jgi:hypothetical protein
LEKWPGVDLYGFLDSKRCYGLNSRGSSILSDLAKTSEVLSVRCKKKSYDDEFSSVFIWVWERMRLTFRNSQSGIGG